MKSRHHVTADQFLTARDAYENYLQRRLEIQNNPKRYNYKEIWECELRKQLASNVEMKAFFDDVKLVEPIDPRDAFFGGRTNAMKLYHKIKRDENGRPLQKLRYVDVCSLYPYVNKYGAYPIGHPIIITEGFDPEQIGENYCHYRGLVKIIILPPRNLYHPVLPYRCNNKLMFPLCRLCAEKLNKEPCEHSDEERALEVTWVTLEVEKALQLGYKILKVHEAWHYEKFEQYHPMDNPNGGLFTLYVNTFLKLKIEAEGWPSWTETEEDRKNYVEEVKRQENIELDWSKVVKNPGKRAIAKLMLNSFWGKVKAVTKILTIHYSYSILKHRFCVFFSSVKETTCPK